MRRSSIRQRHSASTPTTSFSPDDDFWAGLWTTLILAAGMTAIAVPLGAILAFLMVRTDVPGRRALEPMILVPIFLSAVVIAFGYVVALGPVGILSTSVQSVIRFHSLELVLAAVAHRDRGTDARTARLPLFRGGAPRPRQRSRAGRAREWCQSAARRL